MHISIFVFLFLILILKPRLNHAGWTVIGWIRSIKDFTKEKRKEMDRLCVESGSPENLRKMELLKKIHPTGMKSVVHWFIYMLLIPYLINQLPTLSELLQ